MVCDAFNLFGISRFAFAFIKLEREYYKKVHDDCLFRVETGHDDNIKIRQYFIEVDK